MKNKFLSAFSFCLLLIIFLISCDNTSSVLPVGQGELKLPEQTFKYNGIGDATLNFPQNQSNPEISDDGATLGRVLFYDGKLSLNNAIACASCHHQDKAFADGRSVSPGFEGKMTSRNSMAIINPVTNSNLFWDSRSNSALDLSLKPVENHIEMGMEDFDYLAVKLSRVDYYPALFKKAFGTEEINKDRIATALSQFLCSMNTFNSKFDQGAENNFANFTMQEKIGHEIFKSSRTKCTNCHSGANFSAPDFNGGSYSQPKVKGTANIGLDLVYADEGKEDGKFRIPSLRNIALTGPYMHDGRFATLEEVINHYNSGIVNHHALDNNLKSNGQPVRMNLSSFEKEALIAFLKTLTDEAFVKDERFSDPFIRH